MKEVILAIETSCDDTSAAIAIDGIVKSNIINHKISYKFKYPDYKFALLGLTKSLLDSD